MDNSQPVISDTQDNSLPKQGITVNFVLPNPYANQLRAMAEEAQISTNKAARKSIVATLEGPGQEKLLLEISTLAEEIGYLRHQVALSQNEIEGLRLALYLTTELLLVLLGGLAPEVAHKVMAEVLAEEEDE